MHSDAHVTNLVDSILGLAKGSLGDAPHHSTRGKQSGLGWALRANRAIGESPSPYVGPDMPWENHSIAYGIYIAVVLEVDDGGFREKTEDNITSRGVVRVQLWNGGDPINARMIGNGGVSSRGNGQYIEGSEFGYRQQPSVGSIVLVAFAQSLDHPIILGSAPDFLVDNLFLDKTGQPEPNKRIDVHPSYWWQKVNAKGDWEIHHPDGTFISIQESPGSAVWPSVPPSDDVDLTEIRNPLGGKNPPKTITISHPSGSWARIKADGEVEIAAKSLKIHAEDDILFSGKRIQFDMIEGCTFNIGTDFLVNASSSKIDSPVIDITGDSVTIGRNSGSTVIANGNFSTPDDWTAGHTHQYISPSGPSNTGVANDQYGPAQNAQMDLPPTP